MPEHIPTMAAVLAIALAAAIELAIFVVAPRCSVAAASSPAIGAVVLVSGCRDPRATQGAWR